jgi:hypothetical protein
MFYDVNKIPEWGIDLSIWFAYSANQTTVESDRRFHYEMDRPWTGSGFCDNQDIPKNFGSLPIPKRWKIEGLYA